MTRWLAALAVVCWASAVVWHLTLGETLTRRLPPGWSWESLYIGEATYPDTRTGKLPERNELGTYKRAMTLQPESTTQSAVVRDAYSIVSPKSGNTEWQYIIDFEADPRTGRHLNAEYEGDYIVLPQNLDKTQTYRLRSNYIKGVPLQFVREEVIEGVKVFLFTYEGRGEYTESYAGTAEYDGVEVSPGHEIKCASDQFRFMVWAEPVTGEAVKILESCRSGDHIFDIATGTAVEPVLRWGAETAGIDVARRTESIRTRIIELRLARYMPPGLAGLGLLCAVAGAVRTRSRRS